MPCKSPRFVVSPLTAPVEHDRRRCTGRNTITNAVNKFLDDMLLSLSLPPSLPSPCLSRQNRAVYRFPGIASWRRSKSTSRYPRVSRESRTLLPTIFDRMRRKSMCVCARSSDQLQFFSSFEHSWIDDFSTVCLSTHRDSIGDSLTFCRIRPGTRISFTLRKEYERIITNKSDIGEIENNSERFKRY